MAASNQTQRIFMTGATGYVGSIITELAIAQGYKVHGLSRAESGDAKLLKAGAVPVRGDLTSLDTLRKESSEADIVLHLATAYNRRSPGGYDAAWPTDKAAIEAIADGLEGSNKPLVVTGGALFVAPDPNGGETTEMSPMDSNPFNTRGKSEPHALDLAKKAIRVIAIRLAPWVYGRGGSGVKLFMDMSKKSGAVTCVDGGKSRTSTVHVDDVARLYLLAAQEAKSGEIFNASSSTVVTFHQIWEAMATALNLPLKDLSMQEATGTVGPVLAKFISTENRASGAKARNVLGWKPSDANILEEIRSVASQI
ncbi:8580fdb2-e25e-45be-92b8-12a528d390f2 [Sclerotinia trifoliorum]|uniref:8580fdb2-e25e-45be-92b8-12a528d390f2 n=1 Tax=Sclerotinia trifoliorum TaxID=28548 RepID=A0A8H2ZNA0_9HELO|nr:8580fdb2-e25e-45be-92b8-12a528d390f2 [Sclerotinia trifoliorum]